MIEITDKTKCSGCSACYSVCPNNSISMYEDHEGFTYPKVDYNICIKCKKCLQVCPILNERNVFSNLISYAVQNKDESVRNESSSGGAFSAIATYVLKKGGIIFGASFNKNFELHTVLISNINELYKLRGSKYIESKIGDSFLATKKYLKNGKLVCFSGTPCQIEGLKAFLKKDYSNLITIDFLCHGVPSPKLWRKYVSHFEKKMDSKLINVKFRDKSFGYSGSTMSLTFKNDIYLNHGYELQFFKNCYFTNISSRPSCYNCYFRTVERLSDFTLYDCWNVKSFDKMMNDDKGTTIVILHSKKGKQIFNQIKHKLVYCKVDTNKAIKLDGIMALQNPPKNKKRKLFFSDLDIHTIQQLNTTYIPLTIKRRIILFLKPVLYRFGILKTLKQLI